MISSAAPVPLVKVFSFGDPIETGAFVQSPTTWTWTNEPLPRACSVVSQEPKGFKIKIDLGPRDSVVGLGQHVGPVNCRGNTYRLFNVDCPIHTPSLRSMYGAHPFMVIVGERPLGVFIDAPGEISVDAGVSTSDSLEIKVLNDGFYLALISGDDLKEIVARYLTLTGTSFIPPKWAFGYHQSRWSYEDEGAVRSIATRMREHDIPCDVIHMDIHYMQDYKVFTVNKDRFPDLPTLSSDLKEQGIRLISIVDPGVKVEDGYSVYEEGKKGDFFCKRADGAGDFIGAVWPGPSVFPDFFREDVRTWWAQLYKTLKAQGIAGFWNDMNEPSIFYTPEGFKDFASQIHRFDVENDFSEALANTLWDKGVVNKESYYDEFTHCVDGEMVTNREVHNLFGTQMTKAVAESLRAEEPCKRHFLLSRSSYPGMHRCAAIWTGDNHSWWEHLSLNIQQMISLNLTGFLFVGADTGGFGGDCTPEMLVRWTQLSAFAPFFRNHAAMWSKNQEPWAFDERTLALCRTFIKMRYALMPYIYSEFIRSACHREPFIRGLFYEYREAEGRHDEDQFMCGRTLLVAPVVKAAALGRVVYLPQGAWLKVVASENGLVGERIEKGGNVYIEAALGDVPLFLRLGALIPMTQPASHVAAQSSNSYTLLGFTDTTACCEILLDDGETVYDAWDDYPKAICRVERKDGRWSVVVTFEGVVPRPISLDLELWSSDGKRERLRGSF